MHLIGEKIIRMRDEKSLKQMIFFVCAIIRSLNIRSIPFLWKGTSTDSSVFIYKAKSMIQGGISL